MFAFIQPLPRSRRLVGLCALLLHAPGCDALPPDLAARLQAVLPSAAATSSDASSSDGTSIGPDAAQRLYYQFVDDRGQVRFVERLEDVPGQWRERVGFVEMIAPPPLAPGDARRTRDTRLASATRAAAAAPTVILYSADWCGWCRKAKAYLDRKRVPYEVRDVDIPAVMAELVEKTGKRGIPVFEVDGRILTGFDPAGVDRLL